MKKNKGDKYDSGKPDLFLVLEDFPDALESTAHVATFGASKYSRGNWKHHAPDDLRTRYLSSALRHLAGYARGERMDPESGLETLAHAVWNLLAVLQTDCKGAPPVAPAPDPFKPRKRPARNPKPEPKEEPEDHQSREDHQDHQSREEPEARKTVPFIPEEEPEPQPDPDIVRRPAGQSKRDPDTVQPPTKAKTPEEAGTYAVYYKNTRTVVEASDEYDACKIVGDRLGVAPGHETTACRAFLVA